MGQSEHAFDLDAEAEPIHQPDDESQDIYPLEDAEYNDLPGLEISNIIIFYWIYVDISSQFLCGMYCLAHNLSVGLLFYLVIF